jgi:lipopolysaccharide transport system ATP-binding protein
MAGALTVSGLGKRLPRYSDNRPRTFKQHILGGWRNARPIERFWPVRNVSFDIGPGQMLGVIGHNGSGKSTLLRMLGGVMIPDEGRIERQGRLSGLLDLNAGLHPDLSGRDNVMINGVIAGLSRREVAERFDEIVAFAELEDVIDGPVRTYSAGMKLRLGFAVAAHVEPGILLIDEVLSVGDMAFQQKCVDRVRAYKAEGSAIVLVSHDLTQVEAICDQVLWLRHGEIAALGRPGQVIGDYKAEMSRISRALTPASLKPKRSSGGILLQPGDNRYGSLEVEIEQVRLLDRLGMPTMAIETGDPLAIEVTMSAAGPISSPILSVSLGSSGPDELIDLNMAIDGRNIDSITGTRQAVLHLDRLDLAAGHYAISVGVHQQHWSHAYDYHWRAYPLTVRSMQRDQGAIVPPHHWQILDPLHGC